MYQWQHHHIGWVSETAKDRTSPIEAAQICSKGIQVEISDDQPDTRRKILCKYPF